MSGNGMPPASGGYRDALLRLKCPFGYAPR